MVKNNIMKKTDYVEPQVLALELASENLVCASPDKKESSNEEFGSVNYGW